MENGVVIKLNGVALKHKSLSIDDAIWNLGAKFGGQKYNKLRKEGKIQFTENEVLVELEENDEDIC
jgi:hypothetical protein